MDAETASHVFEPFFTTKAAGNGMGLAVVYGMVSGANGTVTLDTHPGRGTTVTIHLPRSEAPASRAPQPRPKRPVVLTGNETILLVEDDEQIRQLAQRALSRLGYRVLTAEDATHAMMVYNRYRGRIDLLVTDVIMPNMGGAELARRLEALGADIKVLFITGYTDDVLVQNGIDGDRAPLLRKPFTPGPLAEKVRQVLDAPRQGRDKAAAAHIRVLIVDDDDGLRHSLRRILRDQRVVEADSLEAAQELLAFDRGFDVILCDIGLGAASGLELHSWLSEQAPDLAQRVVFLTGGVQDKNDRAYLERVGNPTLTKPFEIDQLLATLRACARGD